jgi:trehalose monomycolate/heme transporter
MAPGGPRADSPADATTAIPVQRANGSADEEPPTRAIPVSKPRASDTDAATEKLNARGESTKSAAEDVNDDKPQRRGGGGVSAADLLRREGRL